ncbi:hypothetical protein [Streptomyces sp. NPDC056227]|uniref:hypothetical protein n=1 Tax=Streptomyces sp. NPDC056227 TaxID=3345753 RepID=UPI0035DE2508
MTEMYHATDALLAPAKLTPPPCMLVRRVREGHAPMNTASTTYSCGYVRRAGAVPVSA